MKLAQHVYHLNTFHLLKTESFKSTKDRGRIQDFIKILTLISLKNSL